MRIGFKRIFGHTSLLVAMTMGSWGTAQATGNDKIEFGIARSNLTLQSEDVRQQTLRGIHDLRAVWFRDVVSSATPKGVANMVEEVRLAKQQGLKVLLNVVQLGR